MLMVMSSFSKEINFGRIALLTFFLFYVLSWICLHLFVPIGSSLYDYFTDSYGIIAGIGGLIGLKVAKKWGGRKSILGLSLLLFSVGLIFQFLGQVSYAIYFYVYHIDNPYPSFGEIFYFGSIPIYIYGVYLLGKASGSSISLRAIKNKILVVIGPALATATSYFIFLREYQFDWSLPVAVFLDFGYPVGEAIFISLALIAYVLTKPVLGGFMKKKVLFFIFALVTQYIADTFFLYRTFSDTWYAGGFSDLLFVVSYFLMGYALLRFGHAVDKVGNV